jgi:hypothetical protein
MSSIDAFIDEFGTASLAVQKDGVTTYFIVTAILVREDLQGVLASAEDIRSKFFQSGEMKSSGVGDDDSRRINILERICQLPIKTYTIAIDKRSIQKSSGLIYKRSFFKFVNKKLCSRIYDVFQDVRVVADEHGTDEFMRGFEKYIDESVGVHQDLFFERSFRFSSSKDCVLLQVADMVSGSLARTLDPKHHSAQSPEILKLIAPLSIGVEIWPPQIHPLPASVDDDTASLGRFDSAIRNHCLRQAILFLSRQEADAATDEVLRAQVESLKLLLFKVQFGAEKEFVPTKEIIRHLSENCGIRITKHQVRSIVVSKLRDADVVIAGGPKGYKIPVSESEVLEFVAHAQAIIPPMLSRLSRARKGLLLASLKEFDLLGRPEYEAMRRLVDG